MDTIHYNSKLTSINLEKKLFIFDSRVFRYFYTGHLLLLIYVRVVFLLCNIFMISKIIKIPYRVKKTIVSVGVYWHFWFFYIHLDKKKLMH